MDRRDLITGRAQPGDRPPAEGPLRLVQDFVNTVDRENRVELLDDRTGLRDWLEERTLPGGDETPTAAELLRALLLREALRAMLLDNNGSSAGAAGETDRAVLDHAAARARLVLRFDEHGPHLEPMARGVDAALGEIVAAAFASMLDGSSARLKACPREVCGWAFYDRSTNNGATWCSMRVCGNRVKAGTYYRRRTRGG